MSLLYIVATPIGNLEDVTLRALRILKEVDVIACEDTRVTQKLLHRHEIKKPLLSYHQHARAQKIVELLEQGKDIAYVSDAGTPGISDPGGKLVQEVAERLGGKVKIIPIPGPSALVTALSVSGMPADKFVFFGFPPHKKGRRKFFAELLSLPYTAVCYESPHRIMRTLRELKEHAGKERQVVVCRELTKMFETVYRGTIEEVSRGVGENPKGEFVIIIASL